MVEAQRSGPAGQSRRRGSETILACLLLTGLATRCEPRHPTILSAEAPKRAAQPAPATQPSPKLGQHRASELARPESPPELTPARAELAADSSDILHTPLKPELAARALARAWQSRMGKRLLPRGLAILIAHWALETGRGERMFAHNFGGLKASAEGEALTLWTRERKGSGFARVQQPFRVYRSTEAGAEDYVRLLDRRYPAAVRAVKDGAIGEFVAVLARKGYFTDEAGAYERAMRSLWYEYLKSGVASVNDP